MAAEESAAREIATGPSNRDLAECLCAAAEEGGRPPHQLRALRRAGRAAFRWPIEARDLVAEGRSLTELHGVGPWLAQMIGKWIAAPPPPLPPPAVREGFLTRTEVERTMADGDGACRVRADLQMHTLGSDGMATIGDMARAAAHRGLEYIAITDHSKGLAIAHGMNEDQLEAQGREIERLNAEQGGVRILRAVEMNLSPTGGGDLDPAFLRRLDLVLGAFHSRLRVSEDQTERYLAALEHPGLNVLAHPRGRIFNFRLGLSAEWERVFARARERDRAVEIDAFPDRQDLDLALLQKARDAGVLVSIGSDAHAPSQLEFLDYGIAAARRAGIPGERILNCWSADELIAWAARGR
jgi:histidinol phosphatase-like PHP family hydrolase